ncbi:MAG: hypothetical protein IPP80_10385 [Ignavibacteria bacterium]|nr:hypothetical protein [Ignavibacteria bacterium]
MKVPSRILDPGIDRYLETPADGHIICKHHQNGDADGYQQLKTIVKEAVTEVLREVSTFDAQRGVKAIAGDTTDSLISRKHAASMLACRSNRGER